MPAVKKLEHHRAERGAAPGEGLLDRVVAHSGHYSDVRRAAITCLLVASAAVLADVRDLRSVPTAPIHDPLYIDPASVKRSGAQVSFRYILDVPVAYEAPTTSRRWKSNEMDAVIDCDRRTFSIGNVLAHSGPQGTGRVVGRYSSTLEERKPATIVPGGTFDYLARYLCPAKR